MSNYGLNPGAIERDFLARSIRRRGCALLLLYMAAPLLLGCHVSTIVQAGEKSTAGPFQHNNDKDAQPCPHPGTVPDHFWSGKKGSYAFKLLNSELVKCSLHDGDSAVEPGWAVDKWYDHNDLFSKEKNTPPSKKQVTLLFEQLFQSRADLSISGPSGPPPARDLQRTFEDDRAYSSLRLFNQQAANTTWGVYQRWPIGIVAPASLEDTPFIRDPATPSIPHARVMKLQFARIGLSLCTSFPNCKIKVSVTKEEELKDHMINLVPGLSCKNSPHDKNSELIAEPIPMDCFYYVVVHLKSKTFEYRRDYLNTPNRKLEPSDDVVYLLQGFHVMEANTSTWTWSTFWWRPQRRSDKEFGAACDQPFASNILACRDPWAFYAMDEQHYNPGKSLAVTNPERHFNPYIEKPTSTSNCIYCHARALYHDPQKPSKPVDDLRLADTLPGPAAMMLPCFTQSTPHGTQLLPRSVPGDVVCDYAKPTHFLWSLANALADRQLQQPR